MKNFTVVCKTGIECKSSNGNTYHNGENGFLFNLNNLFTFRLAIDGSHFVLFLLIQYKLKPLDCPDG